MNESGFMQRALELARRGQGAVEPNPMVGAVIVRDGQIVAEGWHQRFGGPHAEVQALADAAARGIDVRGLTMFVTLEPCCHHGKTGPCTDAILAAGLARVRVAVTDPSPDVSGAGIARLRDAGVDVAVGLCDDDARELIAPFARRVTTGLPWTIAKWAQTLDGKIATTTGDSQWISSEASRRRVHQMRAQVDAIVVGIGTALADNPSLTARDVTLHRTARRVVIDPHLRLPDNAKLLTDGGPPLLIACAASDDDALRRRRDQLATRGVELFLLRDQRGPRLDLQPLWRHLVQRHQATNVLVEGGAGLLGSLFDQRLINQVHVYLAPRLVGDQHAPSPVADLSCARISDAIPLTLHDTDRIGDDLLLDYRCG